MIMYFLKQLGLFREEKAVGKCHCNLPVTNRKESNFVCGQIEIGRGDGFKVKEERLRLDVRGKFLYSEGGEALGTAAH